MSKKRSAFLYIVSALACMVIMLAVFAIKGYFPFGKASIALGDLSTQVVPFLHHFYDVITSGESFFYNSSSFFGVDFYGTGANYIFSPLNFILLLFPRESIPQALNILYILRVMLCAMSACYLLRRLFKKLDPIWIILLSISYAICGYTLCMYLMPAWLDAQILFPLVLIAAKSILDGKSMISYIFMLAISLIISFYITMIALLFIFLSSVLYIRFFVNKEMWGRASLRLGIATVLALGIAAFVIIPAAIQIIRSARTTGNLFFSVVGGDFFRLIWDKFAYFFLSTLPFAILLHFILLKKSGSHRNSHFFRNNDKKKSIYFLILVLTAMTVQIIADPINKVWHGGTYASFPMRFGFIPILFFVITAAYCLQNEPEILNTSSSKTRRTATRLLFLVTLPASACFLIYTFGKYYNKIYPETLINTFKRFWPLFLSSFCFCTLFFFLAVGWGLKSRFVKGSAAVLLIIQASFFLLIYTGIDTSHSHHIEEEQMKVLYNTEIRQYSAGIGQNSIGIGEDYDGYFRTKDIHTMFSSGNYGIPVKVNSISHYSSMINGAARTTLRRWGYSSASVSVHDDGGTLFSDSLFGMKYIISKRRLEPPYRMIGSEQDIYLYENPYALPMGIIILAARLQGALNTPFAIQSAVFQTISGSSEELFNLYQFTTGQEARDGILTCEIDMEEKERLYLYSSGVPLSGISRININGTPFPTQIDSGVIKWYNPSGYAYPTSQVNALLDLGEFENTKVKISIEMNEKTVNISPSQLSIGGLKLNLMENVFSAGVDTPKSIKLKGNHLSAAAEGGKDDILFLALPQNSWWRCTVNNKPVPVISVYGGLMGVPLEEGTNIIEMKFIPRFFIEASILSAISLAIACLFVYLEKKKKSLPPKLESLLGPITWRIHHYGAAFGIIAIYVLPLIGFVLFRVFS